jgi:hypothetical protein
VNPDASTLVGYVADSAGHAIPGAQILLDPPVPLGSTIPVPYAVTDSLGAFVLTPIPPGRHKLLIRAITYVAQRPVVRLRAGHADTLRVRMRYYNCIGY